MQNKSGIDPTGHHVLVLPDIVKEKTTGGIYLAPQSRDDEQRAATTGTLIAVGLSSWVEFANGEAWAAAGDHVSFAKYAGIEIDGIDQKKYTLLNDQDILAVLDK